MSSHRVLIVEDDRVINDSLAERLRGEQFAVEQAFDGLSAVTLNEQFQPDLVVLDVMLPGLDGFEVCRRIQAMRAVPVLMLTARDDESDIVIGLGIGADDYLTKPFRMREVVARIRALLRRVDRAEARELGAADTLACGSVLVDLGSRRTTVAGVDVHLTRTEFDLLVCLVAAPGQVLSRQRLLEEVWHWPDAALARGGTRTVDSHVKALRAKIGAHRLRTAHGVGYALEPADD